LEQDSYGPFLKCPQCGMFTEVNEANDRRLVLPGSVSNELAGQSADARKMEAVFVA